MISNNYTLGQYFSWKFLFFVSPQQQRRMKTLRAVLAAVFVFVIVLSFFWRSKSKNRVQIDSFSWKTDIWGPHLATTTLTWNITRYLPPYLASNSKDESKKNVEFS